MNKLKTTHKTSLKKNCRSHFTEKEQEKVKLNSAIILTKENSVVFVKSN